MEGMATQEGLKMSCGQMIEISEKGRKRAKAPFDLATIIHVTRRKVLVRYEKNGFYESFQRVDVENNIDRDFRLL